MRIRYRKRVGKTHSFVLSFDSSDRTLQFHTLQLNTETQERKRDGKEKNRRDRGSDADSVFRRKRLRTVPHGIREGRKGLVSSGVYR